MMPHDDAEQDKVQTMDLIKQTLQKVIDDMTSMESDRYMPEARKPKVVEAHIEAVKPEDDMDSSDEEDPEAIPGLLSKADEADDEGSLPEDKASDLPPEIMDIVRKKKEEMK